jgi:transcriptional regulator with XRE-family HTH domain
MVRRRDIYLGQGRFVFPSTEELEAQLGTNLRALRLERNLDQATLAARAGVSLNALKHLEGGQGSTLKTLVRVLRALGREEWLKTIAPIASINPLTMPRSAAPRQRAAARRKPKKDPHGS